ncbi:unnamed protein product [Meganyctiphanes norvegica]|uniref:CBM21 domain-containing protein n=1 Tax=Meganyctiphanes norvegica TaxID=48144 RepID=A0AAV2QKH8_MEGNR
MPDNWSCVMVGHSTTTGLMTTLMMPGDYGMELLLGSSPVLTSGFLGSSPVLTSGFLGSHHTSPFLTDYSRIPSLPNLFGSSTQTVNSNTKNKNNSSSWGFDNGGMPLDPSQEEKNKNYFGNYRDPTIRRSFKTCRASSRISPPKQVRSRRAEPSKSCLVLRTDLYTEEVGAVSPTREKKKLVFADDQGLPLTEVKLITERPDCPPRWSADFLEQVTGGAIAEAMADTWEVTFSQPAADYLGFKAKLERDNVALENAVVKEAENKITGIIKVKNVSFHKVVRVRYTTNDWRTQEEIIAEYVPSRFSTGASYDYHDTFTFDITLPPSHMADKIEFCICYDTEGNQYWDNNNQKNYVIIAFRPKGQQSEPKVTNDAYHMNLDTWSEFASWKHLSLNDTPFW